MRVAHICFVIAAVSALTAAGFAAAQIQYQNQWCDSTPGTWCTNQCGCPIPNAYWDFCSGVFPQTGGAQGETTYYYCVSGGPYTCTSPSLSCGGKVVNCSTGISDQNPEGTSHCGCCGSPSPPNLTNPCPSGLCWNCSIGFVCQGTAKTGCGGLYGCTGTNP